MANNELKPCPFCGRHNKIYSFADGGGNTLYSINCGTIACPARSSFAAGTAEDVATAWNLRAAPAQGELSDALPVLPKPHSFSQHGDRYTAYQMEEYAKQAIEATRGGALSDADIESLVVWLGDPQDPHFNRLDFARAIEARILGQQGGGDAARVSELELLLQKAARGLRFRSSYTNGDPVLEELWGYMMKHYPQHEGRMSGWASMRDNWQTTSGPHCFGCPCQQCKDATIQAQAGDAKPKP